MILRRALAEFSAAERAALGALALSEMPLDRDDMRGLLKAAAGLTDTQILSRALKLFEIAWDNDKKLAVIDQGNNVTKILDVTPD